ncbi:NAD(P)-dependent oxidoreductase [Nakamurella lactea]|uniref:NAD(P)-dependent oxidoreductase n=1 Tax=Nakamurella lactea TaxID=459515 RepID=UPI0003FCD86D|nr:NAD(P)-dependent oxidoreductase [Nakamurella lactea]
MSHGGVLVCLSDYPDELVRQWVPGAVEVVVAERELPVTAAYSALRRADVVIADAARRLVLDAPAIGQLDRCRLVVVPAVGIEVSLDVTAAGERGLRIVNAAGYNADAVADWTVAAIIDALRRPRDLRETGWVAQPLGRELGSVTVGLVGHGAIGRAVERRLNGFGTTVLHTTSRPPADGTDPGWVSLPELFAASDVVSLHAPLTPATAGMVDAPLLASMPADSILINTARGALVVEPDLVAALRIGRPATAVLDVFAEEPLPADHPLRELDSVRLTPHVAAGTWQARERVRGIVAGHLRVAFGIPPTD